MVFVDFVKFIGALRTVGSPLPCPGYHDENKSYHDIQKAVHPFGFKNFEHLLLGSRGNHNLRPGCRRHLAGTFHNPRKVHLGETHLHFPRVLSPNNGKVGIKFLCPHSRCFGSYCDVICLMYLVSSGFCFKPTSSIILIDPV